MPSSATFLSNNYGNPRYVKKAVKALGNVGIRAYLAGNFTLPFGNLVWNCNLKNSLPEQHPNIIPFGGFS